MLCLKNHKLWAINSENIIPIPIIEHITIIHFFSSRKYTFSKRACINKYAGRRIAITTKIAPANPRIFVNAFGITAANRYAGNIVKPAADRFRTTECEIFNDALIDSVNPMPTPKMDVSIAKIAMLHVRI